MTSLPTDNIFDIANPGESDCKLISFSDGHKMLIINVFNLLNGKEVKLHFGRVAYFSGVVSWKGASFWVASTDELKEFLKETNQQSMETSDHLLFLAQTESKTLIRIFALFGTKEDKSSKTLSITRETFANN